MNDENKDKSEAPTQKRLDDAKKKGQVSKSKEVVSAALVIAMFLYVGFLANWYVDECAAMILVPIELLNQPFDKAVNVVGEYLFRAFLLLTFPMLALVVPIAILSNLMQTGPVFSLHPLKWEYQKVDPIKNMKNIVSMKSMVELLKSLLKLLVLGLVIYWAVERAIADLVEIPSCGVTCIMPLLMSILNSIFLFTSVAFAVVAVLDYFFQKHQFLKSMRMNMDEIRKEYKEQEGDPQIKGKRKELHREIIQEDPKRAVNDATVLVTNPEHIAIGLYYKVDVTPLPMISLKAEGPEARRLKEYAREIGKPVMENVPLAHALMAEGNLRDYIPTDLIEPVAEVIKWALELSEAEESTE